MERADSFCPTSSELLDFSSLQTKILIDDDIILISSELLLAGHACLAGVLMPPPSELIRDPHPHAGRRDSSGIRLHYTPSLRRYDAGIMELGLVYTPVMAIPPKQHAFYLSGYCTSKCTQTVCKPTKPPRAAPFVSAAAFAVWVSGASTSLTLKSIFRLSAQALPPGGIYIFASQLHTHLAGRGVRTVLVRGGKELEVVQEDQHFSTHYQVSHSRSGQKSQVVVFFSSPEKAPRTFCSGY